MVLATSTSYIFKSFSKIMLLVILFGMMLAIFFLPAVLSIPGPGNKAYICDGTILAVKLRDVVQVVRHMCPGEK